jgi:hypothetical protein
VFLIHRGDRKLYFTLDETRLGQPTYLFPVRMTDGADRELPFETAETTLVRQIDTLYTTHLKRITFLKRVSGPIDIRFWTPAR